MKAGEFLTDHIIKNNISFILPADVVQMASDPESPLHRYFEWDDSKAAHSYRLQQARDLIASLEITVENAPDTKVRLMVSVPSDRGKNGYRLFSEVLNDPDARESLLAEMISKVEYWKSQIQLLDTKTVNWLKRFPISRRSAEKPKVKRRVKAV